MAAVDARARKLADDLRALYADLQREAVRTGTDTPAGVFAVLAAPLAQLTKMIIPDVHQKIDEIIYAAEHGLAVNPHQHGHDLADAAGRHIELKVSVAKGRWPKCNFNWPVPKGATPTERRTKLLASVEEKTRGGHAVLEVRSGAHALLATYTLSSAFLAAYFARVPLGAADKHNMACEQCKTHGTFHRIAKMQAASERMAAAANDPGVVAWTALFARTAAQC
jgi:hypothetical protein